MLLKIAVFGNRVYHEPTYVDAVFGGSLVSTVTCNECHNVCECA